jgi:hypothetical protein
MVSVHDGINVTLRLSLQFQIAYTDILAYYVEDKKP